MTLRSRKGFTLIELMIVVAIIGILAAIAIPKFAELMDKARCRDGNKEACKRLEAIRSQPQATTAGVSVSIESRPSEPPAPTVKRDVVRGRLSSVKYMDGDKPQWYGSLSLDNGTYVGITVNDLIVEGTIVCVEMSPNRDTADNLVVCK